MKDYQSVGAIICGFYINYEECKYSKQPFQHSIILSFILTMRNVNELKELLSILKKGVLY